MFILPDVLCSGLRLVFCGTAPSRTSAKKGAYYAHPGNLFWPTLKNAGFVPVTMQAVDFHYLPQYGIGLTDINKVQIGVDAELDPAAFDVPSLSDKIRHFQPEILAFTSKNAAKAFYGNPHLDYGLQAEPFEQTRLWILPSTSGNARPHWPKLKHHWYRLSAWLHDSEQLKQK